MTRNNFFSSGFIGSASRSHGNLLSTSGHPDPSSEQSESVLGPYIGPVRFAILPSKE